MLSFYRILSIPKYSTSVCNGVHLLNAGAYVGCNLLLLLYFGHLARKAKIQSMDILIFDLQLRIIKILFIIPAGFLAAQVVSGVLCPSDPFNLKLTIIHMVHIIVELTLLHMYISWYQGELKRYGGGEIQPEMVPTPELAAKSGAEMQ